MKYLSRFLIALCILAVTQSFAAAEMKETWLDTLDLSNARYWQRNPKSCRSADGRSLQVMRKEYERGVGVQAPCEILIAVDPVPGKFTAKLAVDDEAGGRGHVEFRIYDEEKLLWRSGFVVGYEKPIDCHVEFNGTRRLYLLVDEGPEGSYNDHANWLEAKIFTEGSAPYTLPVPEEMRKQYPDASGMVDHDGNRVDRADENACEWFSLTKQIRNGMREDVKEQTAHPAATILPEDRDPLDVVIRRMFPLIEYLRKLENGPRLAEEEAALKSLSEKSQSVSVENKNTRKALFAEATALRRKIMLQNPLIDFQNILFIKRHPNGEDESGGNHMCDQFFGYNGRPGGGLFILENAFTDRAEAKNILENSVVEEAPHVQNPYLGDTLNGWAFLSPELSFDGKEILFAATDSREHRFTHMGVQENTYHIFKCNLDGSGLIQLTDDPINDFDPCFLPNGRIIFISERRGGYGRCHGRQVPSYTLHSMLPDGRDITMLSPHETNEWGPSVDNAGMVIYTRWDYVDRGFSQAHHPWITTPDGRDARILQGNYDPKQEGRPHLEINIRAIPNSPKIVATAACHHGQAYGSLILVDPTIPDDGKMAAVRRLTPDQLFPESENAPHGGSVNYSTPYPLDETTLLCVYDPFSRSDAGKLNRYGIYLVDAFGNRTLLYRDADVSCYDPIPVKSRPVPPVIPHRTLVGLPLAPGQEYTPPDFASLPKTARVGLVNVYDSLNEIPENTVIQKLRIVQLLPKTTPDANKPRIGYGDQKGARKVLGTVPVEKDGSALFELPVDIPVYFQAIDQNGVAIQSMRSATYVHHGEDLICAGCHEFRHGSVGYASLGAQTPEAMRRQPSVIQPGPDGSAPINFPRLVQPILDQHCVACHETGADGKQTFSLAKGPDDQHFFRSYENLKRFTHYFDDAGWTEPKTLPLKFGSYASPLYRVLKEGHYGVRLSREEMERLTLWMDTNCDFYGAYHDIEDQRDGKLVIPKLE